MSYMLNFLLGMLKELGQGSLQAAQTCHLDGKRNGLRILLAPIGRHPLCPPMHGITPRHRRPLIQIRLKQQKIRTGIQEAIVPGFWIHGSHDTLSTIRSLSVSQLIISEAPSMAVRVRPVHPPSLLLLDMSY
jgi:hypothetical protein